MNLILLMALLAVNGSSAIATCGDAVEGLALCLKPSDAPGGVTLELKNIGTKDLVLLVGVALANGQRQYFSEVELTYTTEADVCRGPLAEPDFVAGRMDQLFLPLAAGASITLPVPAPFMKCEHGGWLSKMKPTRRFTVRAVFVGKKAETKDLSLITTWRGTATSSLVVIGGKP